MAEAQAFFTVQLTLIAVVLVLHTYLGLHVIRRGIVFSDLVLDQLAAFGALVGIGVGIPYGTPWSYAVSLAAVLVGSFLLATIKPSDSDVPREAVIGIMYGLALAASLLLADKLRGGDAYVAKTLSGSMLWVSWPLVWVTIAAYVTLLLFHWRFRGRFIALTEEPDRVRGAQAWDFFFFASLAVITVLVVPIAGVLLAYGFLMIPAGIGALFSRKWLAALAIGWSVGFAACALGVAGSYFLNMPYGPTLIVALGLAFLCSVVARVAFGPGRVANDNTPHRVSS